MTAPYRVLQGFLSGKPLLSNQELLRAAAALVKPGGLVLYVTCALAEAENDGLGLSQKTERKDKAPSQVSRCCVQVPEEVRPKLCVGCLP